MNITCFFLWLNLDGNVSSLFVFIIISRDRQIGILKYRERI